MWNVTAGTEERNNRDFFVFKLHSLLFKKLIYIKYVWENRDSSIRTMIKVLRKYREYLVIYTTEYDDLYILETIIVDDVHILKKTVKGQ